MALSDLFPYGAPELVEGAEPRMSQSLLGAALLVMSVLVLGGVLVGRAAALAPFTPDEEAPPRVFVFDPPPLTEPVHAGGHTVPRDASMAEPVPVRDVAPPPLLITQPALPEAPTNDGPAEGEDRAVRGDAGPAVGSGGWRESEEVLPPGAYVDLMPELLSGDAPRYPDLAREAGVEGRIRVLMRVGTDGRVREARIAPGSSIAVLEEAALEAARSCRFVPARSNGRLVSVWVARTYEFRLH